MKQPTILFVLLFGLLVGQDKPIPSSKKDRAPIRVSKEFRGNFHGKSTSYKASHYETILYEKDDYEKPMASIFVTEYIEIIRKKVDIKIIFVLNLLKKLL